MHEWVKLLDLPAAKSIEIESKLEELGVTKPSDLAGLLESEVDDLLKLVPRLKQYNFNTELAIFRPVLL